MDEGELLGVGAVHHESEALLRIQQQPAGGGRDPVRGYLGSLLWLVYGDVSLAGLAVAVVYSLDFIATVPPNVTLTAAAFGREIGPAVVDWIFAAHQLGVGAMAYATASAAARWAPTSPTSSPPVCCAWRPRRRSR